MRDILRGGFMSYNKEQCLTIFKDKFAETVTNCFGANVFYALENRNFVRQGFVINRKWFVDGETGEISETERFYLINNLEIDASAL